MHLLLLLLIMLANIACADVPAAADLQHPIKNYQTVDSNLATGGKLSQHNLQELKNLGVEQIIDLRRPAEGTKQERDWSQQMGIAYANFPVGRELPDDQLIHDVGVLLDAATDTPTVLHCGSGHRAGIVLALYLYHQGMPADDALERARAAGTRENGIEALRNRMKQ